MKRRTSRRRLDKPSQRSARKVDTPRKRGPPLRRSSLVDLGIAGWRVPIHSHLAYFWETEQDFDEATGFLEAGLRGDDRCIVLGDQRDIARFLSSLGGRGLDVEGLAAENRLTTLERRPTAGETLAEITALFEAASRAGVSVVRLLGNVGWGRATGPRDAELASLEARLTSVARKYASVVLCLHEVRSLTGQTARFVIRTHPQMLEEAGVLGNPFFVPYARFRERLRSDTAVLSGGQDEREAVRRQTEILQAVFDHIPVMISFVDASGRLLLVNREWERVLGWSFQEARGYDFLKEAYPDPESRREVLEFMQRAEARWQDFRTRTKDGRVIDTSWLRVALSNGTRLGFGLDLTERKRSEEALRKSERLLREAEELGRTGSWEQDLVTGEIFNTEENLRLFFGDDRGKGARLEDYVDAVHPDDREMVTARQAQLLAEGGPRDIEFQVIWPDGSVHVISGRATVVRDESGRAVRVYGTNVDVTQRKWTEDRARESQQLLKLVLATLPVGVSVTDRAGDIVLANAASKRIWGGDPIVSGRKRWRQSEGFWHDSGERVDPRNWASVRALTEGQTSLNEVIDIKTFDGRQKTIQNSAAPIRDPDGTIVGAVIVNEDVTERVLAKESLQRSHDEMRLLSEKLQTVREEERARIAREVHDEVGQALTALQLDVAWLEKKIAASPETAPESCSAKLKTMATLLDATLGAVQRIAAELRPGVLDELGLDAAAEWYVREFESRSGIPCDLRSDLKGASVEPDLATAVFRILQEALTNVARHSGANRVEILLSADDEELRLEIRDNGRGFREDRFEASQSLGILGMRERARSLGGDVSVRGIPDAGTTVALRVPL